MLRTSKILAGRTEEGVDAAPQLDVADHMYSSRSHYSPNIHSRRALHAFPFKNAHTYKNAQKTLQKADHPKPYLQHLVPRLGHLGDVLSPLSSPTSRRPQL